MSKARKRKSKPGNARSELAARRATLERLAHEIGLLKGKTGHALYEMGLRFARINEEELWRDGGYESFNDFVERGVDVSRRTAYKLMRVAREFNAAIAERYGVEKLELGLRYLDSTPADERPGDLLASDIPVRDGRGRWSSIPFHVAKTRQILDAIALADDRRRARMRVPADLAKRARRLAEALPPPPKGLSAGERVRLRRGRDGRVAVTFGAIPLDELEAFLRAVGEHLL